MWPETASTSQPPDRDLARGLLAGERWAAVETVQRFKPMVVLRTERSLRSRTEADDISQEVFGRVFQKVRTLREPDKLGGFIYSFTIRVLRNELRRRKVHGWLPFMPHEKPFASGSTTLDIESRDLLRQLAEHLNRLSPRDRKMFLLRRLDSMTIEEIAALTQVSASTVKRSISNTSSQLSSFTLT